MPVSLGFQLRFPSPMSPKLEAAERVESRRVRAWRESSWMSSMEWRVWGRAVFAATTSGDWRMKLLALLLRLVRGEASSSLGDGVAISVPTPSMPPRGVASASCLF